MMRLGRTRRCGKSWWTLALASGMCLSTGCDNLNPTAKVENAQAKAETPPPGPAAAGGHNAPPAQPAAAPAAPETPAPHDAHSAPPAETDPAMPTPPGAPADSPSAAHGAPPMTPAGETLGRASKPTTGQWLAGMATAIMSEGGGQPGQPGAMPPGGPGLPGAAHGAPGEVSAPPGAVDPTGGYSEGLMPGEMEAGPGQTPPGAAQTPKEFDKGTADYAVQQLVLKMQSGTTQGLSEVISEKTKDEVLAPLRDGTATPEQIAAAQKLATDPKMLGSREAGTTMMYYVRNAAGQHLTFSARRDENGDFRVTALRIEEPRGSRRR